MSFQVKKARQTGFLKYSLTELGILQSEKIYKLKKAQFNDLSKIELFIPLKTLY